MKKFQNAKKKLSVGDEASAVSRFAMPTTQAGRRGSRVESMIRLTTRQMEANPGLLPPRGTQPGNSDDETGLSSPPCP